MVADEIRSDIQAIARDSALLDETSFAARAAAIDCLEFKVLDRIEGLLQTTDDPAALLPLTRYAEALRRRLEAVDEAWFRRLRADIREGGCRGTALRSLIDACVGPGLPGSRRQDEPGYDSRDVFMNGLLLNNAVPAETRDREPEMVQYQQTPARVILELAEGAGLTREEIFYDLGSGLGQVPILVNLLSGATTRGIEVEPAYCDHAKACAADLNLSGVDFVNGDARTADLSGGTVFFMYTPFTGGMLQEVLTKLRAAAHTTQLRLFTYGPCTRHVSRQDWLRCTGKAAHTYELAAFESAVP